MIHKFVDIIPENLEEGVLYVSIPYETVIHKCCCGCGNEVVTPLSPADWSITFDGETISIDPSIGNWSLKCKSHYWIINNKVVWSSQWSSHEIEQVKKNDFKAKKEHFDKNVGKQNEYNREKRTLWQLLSSWFK